MSICEWGIHAFRHVSIDPAPNPLEFARGWWQVVRCKRCGLEQEKYHTRYPKIIRTSNPGPS